MEQVKTSLSRPEKSILPLIERNDEERGGGQEFAAGRMPNDLESGGVQVLSFLFCHAQGRPIPPPLGKAEEKARTTLMVLTDAMPVNGMVCFLSCLCVLFPPD